MKKITLLAALLGSVYFSNAQVGIGTPTPSTSAMLEIDSDDKGVLIPRVALTSLTTYAPISGNQTPSLLVYATGKNEDGTPLSVESGFYYWVAATSNPTLAAHWERVINQADLDAAVGNVTNIQGDVTKIKALLDAAYGSNNLGTSPTTGTFGGMVYTPATGTFGQTDYVAPIVEYVKWDLAAGENVKVNVTSQLIDLIKGNETNTTLTKSTGTNTDPIVYTYSNENVIKGVAGATPTEITITADIISSITSNTAVQNAIKNLVSQGNNVGYTVTAIAAGANNGVKNGVAIPANSFYYVDADGLKNVIDLSNVVVNATTINAGSTTEQINNVTKIKQNLGDAIVNDTSVFTGDTIKIGTTTYYIYKGNFPTTVNAGAATTTGTTIDKEVFKILSMQLSYAGGVSANVTDMVLSGQDNKTVAFNVGTGKMYTVLGTSNIVAEVIIEFASPVSPILVP